MRYSLLGKKLLFITAHPDDESYLAAGTIYRNQKAGGQSFLICATLGEKGKAHLKRPLSDSELKKVRRKELQNVVKFLGLKKLVLLGLPDTNVGKHKKTAYRKILSMAKDFQPDFIISFGKDGMSGHLDHIAIGQVAQKTAKTLNVPWVAVSRPRSFFKQLRSILKRRRRFGKYKIRRK